MTAQKKAYGTGRDMRSKGHEEIKAGTLLAVRFPDGQLTGNPQSAKPTSVCKETILFPDLLYFDPHKPKSWARGR